MARSSDPKVRHRIVATMARLLRQQGYAATGLNQLVSESRAPKGSLYHYFPGGKAEVAAAALVFAGGLVEATLEALRQTEAGPSQMVRAYGNLLAGWMAQSGFADGCPITTTLLETTPSDARLAAIGHDAFAGWQNVFATALRDAGVPQAQAADLALLAIMTIEGALIIARVRREATPISIAADQIARIFDRAVGVR